MPPPGTADQGTADQGTADQGTADAEAAGGSSRPARRASDTRPAGDARRPGVVEEGREEALAAVGAALDRLAEGRGGVLLLSGEPGIGKSVLAEELAARAHETGTRVLWGRCHEADVAPAYWPWLPVLREVAGPDPVPELAALVGTAGPSPAPAGSDSADLRTYDAASRALCEAAAERPLLVLLEDIHWADTSSLRLLAYAAERLTDVPLLLALTRRTVDAPHRPAMATALAALSRLGAVRVSLRGLPAGGIERLVEGVVGHRAPDLAQALADRTDGNPFFVLEMARLLQARGATDAGDAAALDVPDGVRDVLRLRVERLGERQQQVLAVASVVGRDIDPALVAQVLGEDVDAVLDDLDELVAAGVVQEADGRYRFTHALTRETVYDSLPPSRRLRRHAAVALALEARLTADPELVADVAHHHRLAARARPDLVRPAVEHTVAAARLARARGAADEVRDLYLRALEVADLDPAPDPVDRHRLLVDLAAAQLVSGDIAGARVTVEDAVALARSVDRWDLVAVAATTFRNAGVWHWREFGETDAAMIETLHRCLDHLDDSPLRARVLASLQIEYMYGWQMAEADRYGCEALVLARGCGDREVLVDAMRQRLNALWGPGSGPERIDLALEAVDLADDDPTRVYLGFELAAAYHQTGLPELADEAMGRALDLAARLRHTSADVPLAWWRFMRALERGETDAAALAAQALALHRRTSVVGLMELTGLVSVRLAPDGADVAPDVVAGARTAGNPAYRATIAQALALAGHPDEAVALLGEGAPDGARDYAKVAADCLRVDTLAIAGRTDLLPAALRRIEPWLDEVATHGSIDALGSVRYFAGRGAEALGDLSQARAHYARAVEHDARVGNVPWGRRAAARLAALPPDRPGPPAPGGPAGPAPASGTSGTHAAGEVGGKSPVSTAAQPSGCPPPTPSRRPP